MSAGFQVEIKGRPLRFFSCFSQSNDFSMSLSCFGMVPFSYHNTLFYYNGTYHWIGRSPPSSFLCEAYGPFHPLLIVIHNKLNVKSKVQMSNQIQSSNEMPKQVRHDKNVILHLALKQVMSS
jgi:hypothetical protein